MTDHKKLTTGTYCVIGFALFSMLFGSGNLIFPPEIGITGGQEWVKGYIAYYLADAVLGICSVFAMLKMDGDIDKLTGTVGRAGSVAINMAVVICIGPLLAIPRNAAVTFEMGLAPLFGIDPQNWILRLVFSLIFFAAVVLLTIRPSKVIDILGKYLTPILVAAIAVLIIRGIAAPAAAPGPASSESLIKDGILSGYQTLDLMAGLFFSIIIIKTIRGMNLPSEGQVRKLAVIAALIAGAILCFVYGGMAYLGASTGSQWTQDFQAGQINQAGLVVNITGALLGNLGVIVLSVIVSLACLTTAIGLTSSAASYMSRVIPGAGYELVVIALCLISCILCNFGLSAIISIAAPILMLCYPVVMFLTLTALVRDRLQKKYFYYLGAGVCFLVSLLTVAADTFSIGSLQWIHTCLPLDSFGFNWLLPTAAACLVGQLLPGPGIDKALL